MKKVSTQLNSIISRITTIIENSITVVGDDNTLLIFLIAGYIPNLILQLNTSMTILNLRSLIFNFTWYCLFVVLSYRFKKIKTRLIFLNVIIFVNFILLYSNLMYFRFYRSFLSLSLIKQLALFTKVADATGVAISFVDILFWVSAFVVILAINLLSKYNKIKFNELSDKTKTKYKKNFLKMALISFILGILTLGPAQYTHALKMWNRPIVFENFGTYNYHIIDIFHSIGSFFNPKATEQDYQQFISYFDAKNKDIQTNEYSNIFKGKNVIVIHAESLEHFVINNEIFGMEITPNFNKIANEGLYFSNYYSQHSIGTSADSEFVFLSSLLPINSGTIFFDNVDNSYNTTAKLLRETGYTTVYMHGNDGTFWNRNEIYPVLGYDMFFDVKRYPHSEKQIIGLGINDFDFFQQSLQYLKNMRKPFYATMITLTNHTPFNDVGEYVTYDDYGVIEPPLSCGVEFENTTLCNYLKSVHYADWAFGQFMKSLEKTDSLKDTVVVIYGDHPAGMQKEEMEMLYGKEMTDVEFRASQKVPFIIWSRSLNEGKEITRLMGAYDAAPTLQNMLGINNPFNLGHDIFSIDNNLVPFVNGDWVDDNIFYDVFYDEYYIINPNISTDMITRDYIDAQTEKAFTIIEMSNKINYYDLISYHYEKKKRETAK